MNSRLVQNTVLVCMLATGLQITADIAKIGVLVLDDKTERPIPNVRIAGIFHMHGGWLAVKGTPDPNLDEAVTDANGRCKVWGRTNTGDVTCIIDPEAAEDSKQLSCYYWQMQGGGYNFRRKNILGIWQPDNVVVTIRLQRVEHPIPLFVKNAFLSRGRGVFPVGADTIQYDLMKGDWLPPIGKGKVADVEFIRHPTKRLYEVEKQMLNRDTIAPAINGVDSTGGRVSSRAAFSAAEDSRPPQRQSISLIAGAIISWRIESMLRTGM